MLDRALTLARTLAELPFELNLWQAQNIWYEILRTSSYALTALAPEDRPRWDKRLRGTRPPPQHRHRRHQSRRPHRSHHRRLTPRCLVPLVPRSLLSSASPMQLHRPIHRMLPRPIQPRLLQREVPLRRLVGIVNQHQARIVLQPLRLLDHRHLVLPHKLRPEELRHRRDKRHVIEDVPRPNHVDAAR